MFRESQQIGPYTLIRKLGRGGFGEVWLGERQGKFATTQVAVKLPLDEQIDHQAIEHEAQLWAKASGHPNVLPIIEADEYDGQIVIVSEYAPDGSLEDWLKTHGKMPIEKAVETTIQILDGLEFLHSRQIIHRDLKPANILLQGKTPRLADFGISRAMRTTAASQSQNISGTFAYMSPEALDGKRSVQTDIWSVGVNLYQFLTGTLPFPQKETSVLFRAILLHEPEPLPDSVSSELKEIIAKSLAKLPENRFHTTGDMRKDLRQFLNKSNSQSSQIEQTNLIQQISNPQFETSTVETIVKQKKKENYKSKLKHQISKDKQSVSKNSTLGNEILAIVFLAFGVLLFLSLISYSQNDPSIITASSQKTQNWIGVIGANIAAFLISFVGWMAYSLPALLTLIAWRFFRAEKLTFSLSRIIGYFLFIVSGATLLTLFGFYGGYTGAVLEQIFSRVLGEIGAKILLFAFLGTAFVLITNFSLSSFFGDFRWAWENFRIRFDEWRGKRQKLIEANNKDAIQRVENRREAKQEIPKKPLKPEEKMETVTKKVSDIFNLSQNFREPEKLEIFEEVSDYDREIEELPPKIFTSEEDILGISKPIDLIAESEKIPITPIQEAGELDADFLEIKDEPEEIPPSKKPQTFENYALPTTEFLTPAAPRIEQKDEELLDIAQELTDKTKEFNVTGRVMHICQGPVVTTYEFKPDPGVKYTQLLNLANELSLALKAESIRIDRIPGKAFVGIEIPNRERETIRLREVIESKKFQSSDLLLSVALGKSIDGLNYVADLAKMPHLFIAGEMVSGKSICLHTIIVSILYKAKPDEVKFLMIDAKRLELGLYQDIPHLAAPIITDAKRASVALKWAVGQIERRYKDFTVWGVRHIEQYNAEVKRRNEAGQLNDEDEPHKKLPYLVIFIDEIADFIITEKDIEDFISRIAQMGRAVGIHLVITSQKVTNKTIANLVKVNFPSRICLQMFSKTDSRTILNSDAAESLLGKGDMLFLPPGTSNLIRVHGAFVDEKEISKIVEHIKAQGNPEYDTTITKTDEELDDSDDLPGKRDPLFREAIKTVVRNKSASTSLLQRHLRIGYGRAAAILETMVREGYIGEMDGGKRARPILEAAYEVLERMENSGEF